jgi:hypothetical protein
MALWDDLITEIYTLTNRPDLVAETALALRQSVRLAHKSGKYWRDLQETIVPVDANLQVQEVDIPSYMPQFRAIALFQSVNNELTEFKSVTIDDLLDSDGYFRTNVYWGMGTALRIRARNPEAQYKLTYYKYPVVFPTAGFNSWMVDEHSDLLILMAATNVLASVGEQEIKGRLETLAAGELLELQRSNIEIVGR